MRSDSGDEKKKRYSSAILTTLTKEQAIKLVANRTHRSDQEAADFLSSLSPGLNRFQPTTKNATSSA
jgi:hypothetical protein